MYLLLTVLAVQQPAPLLASPVSDTAHVVIVATTDVHGRVLGWDYVRDAAAPGGLSRAATMVETLRAQYPEQVVLVDAGDLIEGNLFAAYFAERDSQRPHPVVDALNAMQYDAATPGNHEFDFGTAVLARATGDATYHYVSANIFKGASDTLVYPPHVVVTRGGVKIGITGFTTPGVMVWDRSQVGGRLRVRPIPEAAPPPMRRLERAAGAPAVGGGPPGAPGGPRRLGGAPAGHRGARVLGALWARRGHAAPRLHQRGAAAPRRGRSLGRGRFRPGRGPSGRRGAGARRDGRVPAREHAAGGAHLRQPAQGLSGAVGPLFPHISAGRAADQRQRAGLQLRRRQRRDVHDRLDASPGAAHPRARVPRSRRRRGGQLHAGAEQLPAIGWRRLQHAPGRPRRVRPGRVDPRPARGGDPDTRASDRAGCVLAQLVPGAGRGPRGPAADVHAVRGRRAAARQHAAPGAGDQRFPRGARAAGVALVRRAPSGRRRGAQAVARQPRAGVFLHHDPARCRGRDAGDPGFQLQLRPTRDRRAERVRDRRGGDRQPRVRLDRGHAARPDGRGALSLPRGEYHRFGGHRAARLGRAVYGDRARRGASRGDRARFAGDARDHFAAERAGARLRRRRASGAPRAAAGAGRGRLRHRPGARGCVLRRRRRGDAPRPRRLPR